MDALPNLLYEAGLYRYDDATNGRGWETPLSESNHALDALLNLITRLDQRRMAKDRRWRDRPRHAAPKRRRRRGLAQRLGQRGPLDAADVRRGRVEPEVLRRAWLTVMHALGVPQGVPPAPAAVLNTTCFCTSQDESVSCPA